jgi:hypothetical protein
VTARPTAFILAASGVALAACAVATVSRRASSSRTAPPAGRSLPSRPTSARCA